MKLEIIKRFAYRGIVSRKGTRALLLPLSNRLRHLSLSLPCLRAADPVYDSRPSGEMVAKLSVGHEFQRPRRGDKSCVERTRDVVFDSRIFQYREYSQNRNLCEDPCIGKLTRGKITILPISKFLCNVPFQERDSSPLDS